MKHHPHLWQNAAVALLQYFVSHQFSRGEDSQEWRIDPEKLDYQFVLGDVI